MGEYEPEGESDGEGDGFPPWPPCPRPEVRFGFGLGPGLIVFNFFVFDTFIMSSARGLVVGLRCRDRLMVKKTLFVQAKGQFE
jgi:hypothetical protein